MTATGQRRTKSTYALQWGRYRIVRPDEDRHTFLVRTGFGPELLEGCTVLDGGCGMGRYARIAAESAKGVVGIDLSRAAHAAAEVCRDRPNASFARADLFSLPFPADCFDRIYSIGVLDHTPDPRRAFLELARVLKPGGLIAIWVYRKERPALERVMDLHRAVSTRLPVPVLEGLSRAMAPVGGWKRRLMSSRSRVVQRAGVVLNLMTIGVSMHPDPVVRVCDTLDWYAPKFASRHTPEEVAGWFAEAGLVEVRDPSRDQGFYHAGQGNGINLCGRKPLPAGGEGA